MKYTLGSELKTLIKVYSDRHSDPLTIFSSSTLAKHNNASLTSLVIGCDSAAEYSNDIKNRLEHRYGN